MPKVTFVNEKKEIDVPVGANLRDEARKAGIEVHQWFPPFHCMGHGLCGTCRVVVQKGLENLSDKGTIEKLSLNVLHPFANIGHETDMRLSCQCTVKGDCTVETTPDILSGENFWQKPYPNK
jgi:ferredoxin